MEVLAVRSEAGAERRGTEQLDRRRKVVVLNRLRPCQQKPVVLRIVVSATDVAAGECFDGIFIFPPTQGNDLSTLRIDVAGYNNGAKIAGVCRYSTIPVEFT
jgi:hypothetical protein